MFAKIALFYYNESMIKEGVIEEIVFRNESNGYTVALLSCDNVVETIVGKMFDVKVGQTVRIDGMFVNNKYGEQFSFSNCKIIEPKTCEAIEKYLSSGLIRGVGQVIAHRIVETFGENTLSIMEMSPEKLSKVHGISEKKSLEIGESFLEIKKLERVVMFLQKYDISTNMALKIYNVYGEKTIQLLEKNPYKLVEDIDGIGFFSADKIAISMGIDKTSEFRMRAGMLYVLGEASEKNGHTFLYKDALFSQTQKLLEMEDDHVEIFENVLNDLFFDKVVVVLKQYGNIVMLSKYYKIEQSVAKKLALLVCSNSDENIDVSDEIKHFEERNKIIFHEDQKLAISTAIKCGVSVITGGPGTGKTTIVRCILEILNSLNKKTMLVAPTGRAAKRLEESTKEEAKTIHRALEVDHSGDKTSFKYNERNQLDCNCVIIDEFSMVDINLACSLLKALPRDVKLIIVGDKDQLPSVGAGNVLSDIILSGKINVCKLTKIFRQENNSLIISNAHLINDGEMPILDNSSSDFYFEAKDNYEDMLTTTIELVCKRLPNYMHIDPNKIQVLAGLRAGVCGTINLNKELQEKINPASISKPEYVVGQNTFRCGDKVMQIVNNYDLEWQKGIENGFGIFNGDIGFIEQIDYQNGSCVVVFDDGKIATYSRVELDQLSLAYAITIHKSQGCEFDVLVIPIVPGANIIMTRNLLYTAVTRAKKLVVLVGSKKNIARMVHNTYTIKRFTMLRDFLIEEFDKLEGVYE